MVIRVRGYLPTDRAFITEIVKRLSGFDLPAWRTAEQIDTTNVSAMMNAMDQSEPDSAILVAEHVGDGAEGQPVGFMRLQTQTDYFTGEKQGYIANIAVDKAFEGKGIGGMLMETAEKWAEEKGYALVTLHVFVENERALKLYEKKGYRPDIIKYVKALNPDS